MAPQNAPWFNKNKIGPSYLLLSCEGSFACLWYLLLCCHVLCVVILCKLFNMTSTGDNNFQNGIFAFYTGQGIVVESCVALYYLVDCCGSVEKLITEGRHYLYMPLTNLLA